MPELREDPLTGALVILVGVLAQALEDADPAVGRPADLFEDRPNAARLNAQQSAALRAAFAKLPEGLLAELRGLKDMPEGRLPDTLYRVAARHGLRYACGGRPRRRRRR